MQTQRQEQEQERHEGRDTREDLNHHGVNFGLELVQDRQDRVGNEQEKDQDDPHRASEPATVSQGLEIVGHGTGGARGRGGV